MPKVFYLPRGGYYHILTAPSPELLFNDTHQGTQPRHCSFRANGDRSFLCSPSILNASAGESRQCSSP